MKNWALIALLAFSFNTLSAQAATVAKVLLATDKLFYSRPGSKLIAQVDAQKNIIQEGAALVNYSLESAEVELPGGHILILGPSTTIELTRIRTDAPVLITLSNGVVRLRLSDKRIGHYPALILTRLAVIGVQGDDMMAMAPKNNKLISTLSFSGELRFVALTSEELAQADFGAQFSFAQIERNSKGELELNETRTRLNEVDERAAFALSSEQAVVLKSGQYASTLKAFGNVSQPAAINPYQFHLLQNNRRLDLKARASELIVVNPNQYEKVNIQNYPQTPESGAEGQFDQKRKIFRPKSGGLIDIASGLYAAPEREANFDGLAKIYLPGPLFRIDGVSGQLIAPAGLVPSHDYGYAAKLSAQKDLGERVKRVFNLGLVYDFKNERGEAPSVSAQAPSRSELFNRQRLELTIAKQEDTIEATRSSGTSEFKADSATSFNLLWISESYKRWSSLLEFGYSSARYEEIGGASQSSEGLFNLGFGASRLMTTRLSLSGGLRLVQRHLLDVQTISAQASEQIVRITLPHFFAAVDATLFEAFQGRLKWEAEGAVMFNLEKDKALMSVDPGLGLRLRTGPWWWFKQKTGVGLIYQQESLTLDTQGERESIEQDFSRSSIALSLTHVF